MFPHPITSWIVFVEEVQVQVFSKYDTSWIVGYTIRFQLLLSVNLNHHYILRADFTECYLFGLSFQLSLFTSLPQLPKALLQKKPQGN